MTRNGRSESSAAVAADPLFAVAMLRIALELKKNLTDPLDVIAARVAQRMRLDAAAFRAYLDGNLGLLKSAGPRVTAKPVARAVPAHAPRRRTQQG